MASEGKVMSELISIFKQPRGFEMDFEGLDILQKIISGKFCQNNDE